MKSVLLSRDDLIKNIDAKLKDGKGIQTLAIVGTGGSGKTTLAHLYLEKQQQKSKVAWEINAESMESLKESFSSLSNALAKTDEDKRILTALKTLTNYKEREDGVINFVKERLRLNRNWVLIYDNVENLTEIQKYLPQDLDKCGEGQIILTTRDGNIEYNKHVNHTIQIGELDQGQKLSLFLKIMNRDDKNYNDLSLIQSPKSSNVDETDVQRFLKSIPPFPLDISIAAYYLKLTNTSFEEYLTCLKQNDVDFDHLQSSLLKETGQYTKTRYSIIALSLEHLIAVNDDFKELLLFVSLLDSQNIPRDLLDQYKTHTIVDKFIYNLKKYSLITSKASFPLGPNFSIHMSTQTIALAYLTQKLDLTHNKKHLSPIANILEAYINDSLDKEDSLRSRFLLMHCKVFMNHDNLLTDTIKGTIGSILGATYYYLGYNNTKTKQLLEESLVNLNKDSNANIVRIAMTLSYLGAIYKSYDDKKAKDLLEQSIAIYKKHHKNHIGIARAMVYLGNIYRVLGDYTKAKDLLEQSIIIYKEHHENHVGIARAITYMGALYRDLGNYKKARDLLEQSLIISKDFPEHINNIVSLTYLGSIYTELGDYKKAANLLEQSLIIYKECHDGQIIHTNIAWILVNLGNTYRQLGQYQKARDLLEQSIIIHTNYYYDKHIDIGCNLLYLGNVYKDLGDYEKAKNALEQSLIIYNKNYGDSHIQTARVLNALGETYLLEGENLGSSETFLYNALKIFKTTKHPEAYMVLANLSTLYVKKATEAMSKRDTQQSQYFKKQAIAYLGQAQEVIKANFSELSFFSTRIQSKLKELKSLELYSVE